MSELFEWFRVSLMWLVAFMSTSSAGLIALGYDVLHLAIPSLALSIYCFARLQVELAERRNELEEMKRRLDESGGGG